jgi:hypothetical protein
MRRQREHHREGNTIYRATVTDTISHERVGQFTFSADSQEEALSWGWRVAGSRFGSDIHVRIERISR